MLEESSSAKRDFSARVASLIDIETGWWDVSRVRALFNLKTASDVMKILLNPGQHEDVRMWHEKNGAFSVRSGYRFFKNLTQHDISESSNAHEEQKMWKAIWKIRVPNKYHDIKAAWQQLLLDLTFFFDLCIVTEAVVSLLHRGDQGLLSKFFLIAWSFWYRCNKWTIEHSLLNPLQTANYAISLQKLVLPAPAEPNYSMQKLGCWRTPPGFCKLNIDAALCFYLKKAGVGVVLRDEKENVLMAVSKSEHELHEPELVELLALLRGLQFNLHLGISKVVLESDCLLMVEALATNEDLLSSQSNLLKEVRNLLSHFEQYQVQRVIRGGNQVAHFLAKHAWSVYDLKMWMGSVPSFLHQYIWLDQTNL
ncbi:hypothetical protein F2P56_013257 [Juglans regia]|uniref:RNase H type-1 domain-containing protein n=2 Tax=Juglans regia TaxID=51240 RepID=A0A833XL91_JUGRE|nr:uncharacterized protein LOC109018046 [Juglans regia]KAF5469163.1 hypothetical protein F2P56_013257 [Juglans regia]